MSDLWSLFLHAAFVDNMPLTFFLGLCTFIALSRKTGSALGLGIAIIAVMGVTVPVNHLVYTLLLAPAHGAGRGCPTLICLT